MSLRCCSFDTNPQQYTCVPSGNPQAPPIRFVSRMASTNLSQRILSGLMSGLSFHLLWAHSWEVQLSLVLHFRVSTWADVDSPVECIDCGDVAARWLQYVLRVPETRLVLVSPDVGLRPLARQSWEGKMESYNVSTFAKNSESGPEVNSIHICKRTRYPWQIFLNQKIKTHFF